MSAQIILISVVLGALFGGFGGLFGIGGGLIAIPALGLIEGMDQQVAQGTALVMIVPNVILGFWKYRRRVVVDMRIAVTLATSGVIFTYLTARLATGLNSGELRLAFAAFMVAMAVYLAGRLVGGAGTRFLRSPLPWGWSSLIGVAGGALSGIFGVGGATIAPPALTAFFGVNQMAAQGLALALIAPGTVIALLTYAHAGEVDWRIGIPLAIGGVAAVSLGVKAAQSLPENVLRLLFCGLLVATAGLLLLHG
jgi:uncharacterized membrane protein YfcA